MSKQHKPEPARQLLVLIANGFDDAQVLEIVRFLRKATVPVYLVGPSSRHVRSISGVDLGPDYSLDNLPLRVVPGSILLLPAGDGITALLQTDPRVRTLVIDVLGSDGKVFVTDRLALTLLQTGIDDRVYATRDNLVFSEDQLADPVVQTRKLAETILLLCDSDSITT